MRRTRVILDVDGVVADFVGHTISMLGDLAPPGGRDAFTAWDMVSVMSPEAREVATREWRRQGWCLTMPVLPNAQNAVDRLSLRADVVWATAPMSRAPHWMYERAAWLGRMFAADPDSIVFAHDKSHVWGDVFVDDKPENVDRWASVHRDGVALLWEAPYNLGWTATLPNTRRATRWRDVFDIIQR